MRLPVDGWVTCGRTTPVTGQDRPRRLLPFPSDFLEVCPPPLYSPGPPGMAMERWCLTNSIDGWHCGATGWEDNRYYQKGYSERDRCRNLSPDGSEPGRARTSSAWLPI